MILKIILKLGKYILAFVITMFLWDFAGQAVTAKDNIAVIAGIAIYCSLAGMWIWMIANDFLSLFRRISILDKSDHCRCSCHKHTPKQK